MLAFKNFKKEDVSSMRIKYKLFAVILSLLLSFSKALATEPIEGEYTQSWSEWTLEHINYGLERSHYVVVNALLNAVVYSSTGVVYFFVFAPPEQTKDNLKLMRKSYIINWLFYGAVRGGTVRLVNSLMRDKDSEASLSLIKELLSSQVVRGVAEITTMTFLVLCPVNTKTVVRGTFFLGAALLAHSAHSLSKQDIKSNTAVFDSFLSKEYLPFACAVFRGSLKELLVSFDPKNPDINQNPFITASANAGVGSLKKMNDFGLNTDESTHFAVFYSLLENVVMEFLAPFVTITLQNTMTNRPKAAIPVIVAFLAYASQADIFNVSGE